MPIRMQIQVDAVDGQMREVRSDLAKMSKDIKGLNGLIFGRSEAPCIRWRPGLVSGGNLYLLVTVFHHA